MTAAQWDEAKRLFGEALDLPPAARAAFLEAHCPDPEVRREILSLLAEADQAPSFLEEPPRDHLQSLEEALAEPLAGQHIGPYRLTREIGRGGMGLVFEALREGEDFQKRFALKVIRAGFGAGALDARFRRERQILSRLDHPGIAALLDGGATPGGLPYLVMEFVEGQPIHDYVREQNLSARAIVQLAIEVCHAVAYAHQRLIVHCDLKPTNILITPGGQPKLLDFGIARILSDTAPAGAPQTGLFLLTPGFASPEQLRGEPVTTASDIYSLGVLLYTLLTRSHPYAGEELPPLETMRRALETDPAPPSRAAAPSAGRLLRGDLDNIVLKCLRKEPALRYASASALAADLESWLEGRPVSATPPTFRYRAARWISRNKTAAAALAAVALSLAGGAAATLWQAREAHLARLRADARSLEIQKMARSLIFEIHESLGRVPGATESQALLLERATAFLDSAAREAAGDQRLALDLAEGYRRLATVTGSSLSNNLGRPEEALSLLRKGRRLAESAAAADPRAFAPLDALGSILVQQGLLESSHARPQEVEATAAALESLIARIAAEHRGNPQALAAAAVNWSQLALIRTQLKQFGQAEELYRRAIEAFQSLPAAAQSPDVLSQYAFSLKRLGALLIRSNRLGDAEPRYREALAIEEKLIAADPSDSRLRYNMTFTLSDLGLIAKRRKQFPQAAEAFSRAAAIRGEFASADPKDVRALAGAANVQCHLTGVYAALARFPEARRAAAACIAFRERLSQSSPSNCMLLPAAHLVLADALLLEAQAARPPRPAPLREAEQAIAAGVSAAAPCPEDRAAFEQERASLLARLASLRRP